MFPDATLRAIYRYTNGIPRLVNTLCDNCLQIGFALQSPDIRVSIVEEAAADLDLTPSPLLNKAAGNNGKKMVAVEVTPSAAISRPAGLVPAQRTMASEKSPPRPVPFESYVARQKSLGFFASLMDRWI